MKKTITIVALLAVSTLAAVAQNSSDETDNREKLQFGLRAGLNYSNVYDSKGQEFQADAKVGFAGGFLVAIPIGKYFGIQPEILISQKGFEASGLLFGNKYNFTKTTTYIDVPLQFAVKPSEFLTILAGPQFSYLINQKDAFSSTLVSYQQEQEFKQDNIRKNIFGAVFGVDVNIKQFVISLRANWDLQTNAGDGTSSTPRYKNLWYQGTVGFKLYN